MTSNNAVKPCLLRWARELGEIKLHYANQWDAEKSGIEEDVRYLQKIAEEQDTGSLALDHDAAEHLVSHLEEHLMKTKKTARERQQLLEKALAEHLEKLLKDIRSCQADARPNPSCPPQTPVEEEIVVAPLPRPPPVQPNTCDQRQQKRYATSRRQGSPKRVCNRRSERSPSINPRPGAIWLAYWAKSKTWFVALILPFGSFATLGMPDSAIEDTGLLDHIPDCYCRNETGKFDWSEDFREKGPLVAERQFPVMYFNSSQFPTNSSVAWVASKDLRPFNTNDPNTRLIPYYEAAQKYFLRNPGVSAEQTIPRLPKATDEPSKAMHDIAKEVSTQTSNDSADMGDKGPQIHQPKVCVGRATDQNRLTGMEQNEAKNISRQVLLSLETCIPEKFRGIISSPHGVDSPSSQGHFIAYFAKGSSRGGSFF